MFTRWEIFRPSVSIDAGCVLYDGFGRAINTGQILPTRQIPARLEMKVFSLCRFVCARNNSLILTCSVTIWRFRCLQGEKHFVLQVDRCRLRTIWRLRPGDLILGKFYRGDQFPHGLKWRCFSFCRFVCVQNPEKLTLSVTFWRFLRLQGEKYFALQVDRSRLRAIWWLRPGD